jgi:hypothetical protein
VTHARTAAGFVLLAALATGCGSAASVASSVIHHSAPGSGKAPAAPPECSVLRPADVLAVAATFPHVTITIDGHDQHSAPPTTLSGDQWAQLTVVARRRGVRLQPRARRQHQGTGGRRLLGCRQQHRVVKVGQDVLQVVDNVPASTTSTSSVATAYRQAAQALAAKIVSRR